MVIIDLFGDEDVISMPKEEDPDIVAKREEMRKKFLEDLFKRAPALQIIPVKNS